LGWAKRLRLPARLSLLAVATAACVSSNPVVEPAAPRTTAGGGSSGTIASTPARGTPLAPASPGKTNPGAVPAPTYDDDGSVGAMARTYLRRSPATALTVEVDWVSGRDPSSSALDHLASILTRELHKPGGITIQRDDRISSSRTRWSVADLTALERTNRHAHSSGSRATIWICYVGGSYADSETALAVTFSASSVAVFRDRFDDATTALILASEVERSVLVHEAGHLMALVNIGYRSRFDHEDPAHPHHSNNTASVMYWAVEDVSVRNLLRGGPPADFDDADRADLALLRGS
jgi:hypothetical protein